MRQDDQPGVHLRKGVAEHPRQADLAGDRDRADPVLRLSAGGSGLHPRLQDSLPSVHGSGAGVLQRLPQADPEGRGWGRLRRGQPGGAAGREHRVHAQPVRQPGRV